MASRLIGVGNAVIDVVAAVPALPPSSPQVRAASVVLFASGGCTALIAAARQGVPVLHAGPMGAGPLGDLARRELAEEGVAVVAGRHPGHDADVTITLVDPDGEQTVISSGAPTAQLSAADLKRVSPEPGDAVLVFGHGLVHPANTDVLVPWVRALRPGVLVVLDPGPVASVQAPEALHAVRERADWCCAAATDAARLSGQQDPVAAARSLRPAVVRTGPVGCVVAPRDGDPVTVPSFPVPVVDRTGAGGTHTGVFVAELLHGAAPHVAARRANAAAALAVSRRGPAGAPTARELDAFLAERA